MPADNVPIVPRHFGARELRCRVFRLSVLLSVGVVHSGCTNRQSGSVDAKSLQREHDSKSRPLELADEQLVGKSPIQFVNAIDGTAASFVYKNGEDANRYSILESLGGGAAVFDFDRDGCADVALSGGGGFGGDGNLFGLPPALFRNEGTWNFSDVSRLSGVALTRFYQHAAIAGDYDNNGFPDLLITGYGGLTLYRNEGDGTFSEVTEVAGLNDRLWSVGAAFGDIDGDGYLDLYVTHYVDWSPENDPICNVGPDGRRDICPPREFQGLPDSLLISQGEGTFRDMSKEFGLRTDGKGLAVVMADLDLDSDVDVYVTNDTVDNFFYVNQRDQLSEVAAQRGSAFNDRGYPDGSMGVGVGDVNLDGQPDLFVANYERESFAVYRNEGSAMFQHVSSAIGVTAAGGQYVGWGTVFLDADLDGDEDMFVANGHVVRFPHHADVKQPPLLFENQDGDRLVNVAPQAGEYLGTPHMGRGVASGDLDRDGDVDLVMTNINEPAAFLDNQSNGDGHWIAFDLVGTLSSRDAIGAQVRIQTASGNQFRLQQSGGSYASTLDRTLFFGLGADERIELLSITWPSGTTEEFSGLSADAMLRIVEGDDLYRISY